METKQIETKLSINRVLGNEEHIKLELQDAKTGNIILNVETSLKNFSRALTGKGEVVSISDFNKDFLHTKLNENYARAQIRVEELEKQNMGLLGVLVEVAAHIKSIPDDNTAISEELNAIFDFIKPVIIKTTDKTIEEVLNHE